VVERVAGKGDLAAGGTDLIDAAAAGYGLFGAAQELTDAQVEHIVATNLTASIQLIRSALPHLRARALLTTTSMPPSCANARSTTAWTAAMSVTSRISA
jgi:NAD(P)-dependent dehydrogenase (short-subunit alcohol dehydrogenase family)